MAQANVKKKDFRILVADDDEIARDVVASLFSQEGYPVVTARDGDEAMSAIDRGGIGLVITDLKMPGADGIEVLRHALGYDRDTAVVILTAYGTIDTTLDAMKAGAFDYLTKPFKGQEIVLLAERAHARSLAIREQRELRRLLRETYLDAGLISAVAGHADPVAAAAALSRTDQIEALGVLAPEEAGKIRERLIGAQGRGKKQNAHRG